MKLYSQIIDNEYLVLEVYSFDAFFLRNKFGKPFLKLLKIRKSFEF
jgi:hypothetical protein